MPSGNAMQGFPRPLQYQKLADIHNTGRLHGYFRPQCIAENVRRIYRLSDDVPLAGRQGSAPGALS
ncbi:hypothetical protein GCM10010520_12040 [Rhizobium viscosum]|uniref:Uncharacterized protein n=1 Tax=Rhizobium viscosum TaxID=1673 RepID=A0ABR9IYG8_RHIVS|nr:hypothetical protein [Rhizobium viscosum]MBE1508250.1 hypothetical protein [Rhizobium viscosum]